MKKERHTSITDYPGELDAVPLSPEVTGAHLGKPYMNEINMNLPCLVNRYDCVVIIQIVCLF
jgi:hypothetical protein